MNIFRFTDRPIFLRLIETFLFLRGLLFIGSRYVCPCCGWRLRAFTHGNYSFSKRHNGYCPRCNAKSRHRRDWLFLEEHTDLFSSDILLLHISPKYSLSRRFVRMPNIDYIGVDLEGRPNASIKVDISGIPVKSETFDALICIHVLEHVENDLVAISEMFRVLRPGGWAFITVPIRLNQKTYEDPSINTPEDRLHHFGEEQHVRFYGCDFSNRLQSAGFNVRLDPAENVNQATTKKFGLLADENVFFCIKPD
jgi:predicted SAM-dependent methyltransferase